MKIKCKPEDFQVDELTDVVPTQGTYGLYRLKKRGIGTPEALDRIQHAWGLARHRLSYGGLKDKHAVTTQYITIQYGPRKPLSLDKVRLEYLGPFERPFVSSDIAGNRFQIVLRDLSRRKANFVLEQIVGLGETGVPNYFDDQRFGSVGESREFIAQPWCQGNYERALWLIFADSHPDDRAEEKEQKQILRENWGNWKKCQKLLARSHRKSVITYLADKTEKKPNDYRGAIARVRADLRSLYVSAFQSFIWNRMLATLLTQKLGQENLVEVPFDLEPLPFFRTIPKDISESLLGTLLPFPSARLHLEPSPILTLIEEVMKPVGMELRELRLKYPRNTFFSKGERPALIAPQNLEGDTKRDEIYEGRSKAVVSFELPRGAYATIVIKRISLASEIEGVEE